MVNLSQNLFGVIFCLAAVALLKSALVAGASIKDYLNVIDGSGECRNTLPRQEASIWAKVARQNYGQLEISIIDMIASGNWHREVPGPLLALYLDRCAITRGKCDSDSMRTESVFFMKDNVRVGNEYYRMLVTNGIPDHCYQVYAEEANPNHACEHYAAMLVPMKPTRGNVYREHILGPVGIAISGAYLYNHESAEPNCNVAAIIEKPTFDPCDGHADPSCRYHYHKAPVCIKGWNECALMGYMADGFPVYGKCIVAFADRTTLQMKSNYIKRANYSGCDASHYEFQATKANGTLDRANGFYFSEPAVATNGNISFQPGTYAYFFTPEYPFIMPGYYGELQNMYFFDVDDL